MNRLHLMAVSGIIGLLLVSGCLTETSDQGLWVPESYGPEESVLRLPEVQEMAAEDMDIYILNVSADKATYHSSELVNLSVLIHSSSDIDDVMVTAKGVSGRMNLQKTLNLSAGDNGVSFTYTLPRCNVCGGISEGTYDLSCEVSYGNKTVNNSTSVQILQ
jgi:hypothetical protein